MIAFDELDHIGGARSESDVYSSFSTFASMNLMTLVFNTFELLLSTDSIIGVRSV